MAQKHKPRTKQSDEEIAKAHQTVAPEFVNGVAQRCAAALIQKDISNKDKENYIKELREACEVDARVYKGTMNNFHTETKTRESDGEMVLMGIYDLTK